MTRHVGGVMFGADIDNNDGLARQAEGPGRAGAVYVTAN